MKKYHILLVEDELETDLERYQAFRTFLENKWDEYIKTNLFDTKGIPFTQDLLEKVLKDYKDVPYAFDVTYIDNVSDGYITEALKRTRFDAFFLDVDYSKAPVKTDLTDVLSTIERELRNNIIPPIFIYSSHYDKSIIQICNDAFTKVLGNRTPNRFYEMKEIHDWCRRTEISDKGRRDFSRIIQERQIIYDTIARSKGLVTFGPKKEDFISLLHISDLQFGDPKSSNALNGIINNIVKQISDSGEGVDLLIITGDIAMRGKTEEFNAGKEFINILRNKLWPDADEQEKKARTLVVPGNHDYDLRTSIIDYFNVKIDSNDKETGNRKLDFKNISEQISTAQKTSEVVNSCEFGLQAFRKFAYELTGHMHFLTESLDFVDNRFENWGLLFYCLNSVGKISAEHANRVFLEERADFMERKADAFPIILCHHTLLCHEKDEIPEEDAEQFRKTLLGYVSGNDCKLIIGGHRHKSDTLEAKLSNNSEYRILEAASLRVQGENNEYIRGLSKYKLIKENNMFTKVEETVYQLSDEDGGLTSSTNIFDI